MGFAEFAKTLFLFFPLFISYTVGDSFYSGKLYSSDTYTVHHTVTIPGGASVKFARLYPYWTWSPTYPDMKRVFDGNEIAPDRQYTDRKGRGVYDYSPPGHMPTM